VPSRFSGSLVGDGELLVDDESVGDGEDGEGEGTPVVERA
jgi:hypothetical protein